MQTYVCIEYGILGVQSWHTIGFLGGRSAWICYAGPCLSYCAWLLVSLLQCILSLMGMGIGVTASRTADSPLVQDGVSVLAADTTSIEALGPAY